jgi:lipoprotein-anchoring transpeptidase ErfK/SrfK
MAQSSLSRRRFLAAAAATLAAPAAPAPVQAQLWDPLGDFLRGILGDPSQQPYPPPAQEPSPAQPYEREIVEDEWFLDSIPDGPFRIRRVNFEMLDPVFRRQLVSYSHSEQVGTLVVDPRSHFLYSLREGGQAIRYGVGVGREGFGWSGRATVGRKAEWPDWVPPKEMILRQPELPERMPGGPDNPLGARALYLYEGNRDTLYRIHGTKEPWTIGTNVSSGCVRLLNEEIADLYLRTPIGTRVVVL